MKRLIPFTAAMFAASVLAGPALVPGTAHAGDKAAKTAVKDEKPISMDQLPAAARTALEKEAKGGTIGQVMQETEKGKMVYEAEITKDGKQRYVSVSQDGKIVKRESAKKEAKDDAKPK
ncbi:MAG TPA: hypothetical protein VGL09_10640 [Methylomirabilota bacterium]|jgi:uncharacterized membrane protein YkoI